MRRRLSCGLVALMLLLCGCMNATEVDEYNYVQSIGVDRGTHKKYMYSFLLQTNTTASGGEPQQPDLLVLAAEGDSIFEAIATLTSGLPFDLNFSRANFIVFSETVARAGEMDQFLMTSHTGLYIRPSIKVAITTGKAEDFQAALNAANSPNLTKVQYSLMQNYKGDGSVPIINYTLFTEAVMTGRFDPAITLCHTDENVVEEKKQEQQKTDEKAQSAPEGTSSTDGVTRHGGMGGYALGSALFDGIRMVGVLNDEETRYLLMATGELRHSYLSYIMPDGKLLVVRLSQRKRPKVTLDVGETPRVAVTVELTCRVDQDMAGDAKARWEKGLRDGMRQYIEGALQRVFLTCRDMGSDAMRFGTKASRHFSDQKAWEAYGWKERYKNMEAVFKVNLQLHDPQFEGLME